MGDGVGGSVAGLTILDDPCRGCGACCEYMGVPPGYAPAYEEDARPEWWSSEDAMTLQSMPTEVRDTLDTYYRGVRDATLEDRERLARPCLWYDEVARRCSYYRWRPVACRDFEPGGDDCLAVRDYADR